MYYSFSLLYTGLFISPSGISELDCATTETDTKGCTYRAPVRKDRNLECLSLSFDMLLSTVSVLVVAQSSSEIPEGLMNNPVY